MLISRGNLKLGSLPSFSLPVITTCPGKTEFCCRFCYGLKGNSILSNVHDANSRRLSSTLRRDFVDIMIRQIRQTGAPAFRLHDIGDFYSEEYIEKWVDISNQLPSVIFFGSTRSWHCDFLVKALKQYRDLENVFLKASIDVTDTVSPQALGWNVWSIEGEEVPCPHDEGKVATCLECRRCWTIRMLDVSFRLRWAGTRKYLRPRLFQ